MSRTRRPPLQWRLRWLRLAARRERSMSRRAHLNLSLRQPRHHPQHLRQVNRDHERRAVVAAAEVVAEAVRGRELLQLHQRLPQKIPRLERPRQKHPPRNQWLPGSRRIRLCRLPRAPARERWFWRSGCRDRARVRGSSGTTFIRFRAICCVNFFSMTRRSSAFRIWCFRT